MQATHRAGNGGEGDASGLVCLAQSAVVGYRAAMRYLLWFAWSLVACSGPEQVEMHGVGREIPPAQGVETDAVVANRTADPAPKEATAAPTKPPLPTTSAIKTEAPLDVAAAPTDGVRLESGLVYKTLRPGDGALASPDATVSVHYAGWTVDGALFDSSVTRQQALTIGLHQVIPGWREGVGTMKVGEIRRLWIPQAQAYAGRDGAPKGMLVFDVELLRIE